MGQENDVVYIAWGEFALGEKVGKGDFNKAALYTIYHLYSQYTVLSHGTTLHTEFSI